MAIIMNFSPPGFTAAKYDESIKALEAAGASAPEGRLYHLCYGDENNLKVTDVWESQEKFDAFGQTLMPILTKLGIDPGQPEVINIHNIIKG